MGKQRLRNWILNNQFFSYQGQFSKSAFIAMSTWAFVMARYMFSGLNLSAGIAERKILGRIIPAISYTWKIDFPEGASIALLTTCFALYFGTKFSPDSKNRVGENGMGAGIPKDQLGETK